MASGEPLQFWYMPVSRPYFPNPKEIAEAIAADLAKSGITVQRTHDDWTVYLDKREIAPAPLVHARVDRGQWRPG